MNSEARDRKLKVLSLNCWGLKYVADKRRQRLAAIAEWIAGTGSSPDSQSSYASHSGLPNGGGGQAGGAGYDIIALQEIWVRADFDLVAARAREVGLVHSCFFYSGAIGSGLAILSAHPIISSFIHPFQLNGFPLHFIEGDFFAGKSVCGICIEVAGVGKVDVLNSHMYAPGGEGDSLQGAHRLAQAWELVKIVQEKAERGRHVILTGDFNSQPYSIIMRMLLQGGSLYDAWALTHDEPPSITSAAHRSLSALQVLDVHGITCDSPLNTYSAAKLAKRSPRCDEVIRGGKRLDYILFRSPDHGTSGGHVIVPESTNVVLTEPVPSLGVSYSDHFGLEAVLSFVSSASSGLIELPPKPAPLSTDDLSRATSLLHSIHAINARASAFQLQLFGAALALTPILAIAASFQPLRYLGWIFVLLGVATGAGGATMLYVGFVGGRWERGGLRNVIVEMEAELDRRRAQGSGAGSGTGRDSTEDRGGRWND